MKEGDFLRTFYSDVLYFLFYFATFETLTAPYGTRNLAPCGVEK